MNNKLDIQNYFGLLKSNTQIYFLDKEINIIGRAPSCNIILNVYYFNNRLNSLIN